MGLLTEFRGRKVVFSALTGSHNYHLNTEHSDKDYKHFVLPTFDDLYSRKEFYADEVTPTEDYTVSDLRKFASLLYKGNPAYLEVLFAEEKQYAPEFQFLLDNREELVYSVRFRMFNASMGMYHEKMRKLHEVSQEGAHYNYEQGYDGKQAHHAMRLLQMLTEFARTQSFEHSFRYEASAKQALMLELKRGEPTYETVQSLLEFELNRVQADEVHKFYDQTGEKDSPLFEQLNTVVHDMTQEYVRQNS